MDMSAQLLEGVAGEDAGGPSRCELRLTALALRQERGGARTRAAGVARAAARAGRTRQGWCQGWQGGEPFRRCRSAPAAGAMKSVSYFCRGDSVYFSTADAQGGCQHDGRITASRRSHHDGKHRALHDPLWRRSLGGQTRSGSAERAGRASLAQAGGGVDWTSCKPDRKGRANRKAGAVEPHP